MDESKCKKFNLIARLFDAQTKKMEKASSATQPEPEKNVNISLAVGKYYNVRNLRIKKP